MTARTRVVAISAVAAVLAGGALAGGVAEASGGTPATPSGAGQGLSTATIVRTTLISTTQVSGSLGYAGTLTIINPSGVSAQEITHDQQAVTQAQNALTADQTASADAEASGAQAIANAQTGVGAAQATLSADQAAQATDCAGTGSSSPACAQDGQKVSQDQAQLAEAKGTLATAQLNDTQAKHQGQAKLTADTAQLQSAQAALTVAGPTEVNPGTLYTSFAAVGKTVTEGQGMYAIDGAPVVLLYGSSPAWRAFEDGMADGPDVGELTQNLITLGFGAGLAPSDHFSATTAAAVQRWQASIGVPQTGVILLGQVIFEPGAIRVTTVVPKVGQAVSPGPVLDATSTSRVVSVALPVSQEYLVKAGNAVGVVLPAGTTSVPGHVRSVSTVAQGAASGSNSGPTVNVTITLDDPAAAGSLDQAPVDVNITTQRAPHVLAVPVDALLALAEGGDAVEVVSGGTHHLVGVQTGLFSNTLVQISGPGITAGTRVEVPSA